MSTGNYISEIKELIKNNDKNDLEIFFLEKEIKSSEENDEDFKKLIIFAIEQNISIDIVECLINKQTDRNVNFKTEIDGKIKIPLYSAIAVDNFDLANILIERYNADIDHSYRTDDYTLTDDLNSNNLLNCKRLNYALEKGCLITYNLLCNLIATQKNQLYEQIWIFYKFKNEDIVHLLNLYKKYRDNRRYLSTNDICKLNEDLKNFVLNNKKRAPIEEELYEKAIECDNNDALRISFENENDEDNIVIKRIIKYDLFRKSIDSNSFDYVNKILEYKPLHYMCTDYEEILSDILDKFMTSDEINKKNNIAKLIIRNFIKSSVSVYNKKNPSNPISIKGTPFRNFVLSLAIKKENMDAVKYLSNGCTPSELNTKDIRGNYPIFATLENENTDMIVYLLGRGIDCNIKNSSNTSFLSLAILKNKYDIIQRMLIANNKIIINEKISNNCTPLEIAINREHAGIVHILLSHAHKYNIEMNINEKSNNNNYPLINTINKNNLEMVIAIVDYCVSSKISMDIYDNHGNTPLTLSYKNDNLQIFNYLLEFFNINQKDLFGNVALHYAVINKDIETVKRLLIMGADLHLKNKYKKSPMDIILYQENYSTLKTVIKYGNIDVNLKNSEGESLLNIIIKSKKMGNEEKEDLIKLLIEQGVNVNIVDKFGYSPLYHVFDNPSFFKLLSENGAYYLNEKERNNDPMQDNLIKNKILKYLKNYVIMEMKLAV